MVAAAAGLAVVVATAEDLAGAAAAAVGDFAAGAAGAEDADEVALVAVALFTMEAEAGGAEGAALGVVVDAEAIVAGGAVLVDAAVGPAVAEVGDMGLVASAIRAVREP